MLTRNPQVHFSSILTVQNAWKFSKPFSSKTNLNLLVHMARSSEQKNPVISVESQVVGLIPDRLDFNCSAGIVKGLNSGVIS